MATKYYVDQNAGGLPTNSTINSIATENATSANWSNNNFKITSLATPTLGTDACTKAYADGLIVPST